MSVSDLKAIVIPADMVPMLEEKLRLKKPKTKPYKKHAEPKISVPIRWAKCCEYFVQIQWFGDDLVIFKGWEDFAKDIHLDWVSSWCSNIRMRASSSRCPGSTPPLRRCSSVASIPGDLQG